MQKIYYSLCEQDLQERADKNPAELDDLDIFGDPVESQKPNAAQRHTDPLGLARILHMI